MCVSPGPSVCSQGGRGASSSAQQTQTSAPRNGSRAWAAEKGTFANRYSYCGYHAQMDRLIMCQCCNECSSPAVGRSAELTDGHGDGWLRETGERTQSQTLWERPTDAGARNAHTNTERARTTSERGNWYYWKFHLLIFSGVADVEIMVKEPAWGCTGSNTDESHYVLILSESLKLLLDQTEEKASRMKQLLVKTKKDLGDAKQKVSLMNSVSAGVLWMYGVKN